MTPRYPDRAALFAGSFDPFTIGHKSIVDRGLQLFDRVIIAIGVNPDKADSPEGMAVMEARVDIIKSCFKPSERVDVIYYTGLTVDAAARHGARFLLRGARTVADFEYERSLADINRNISGIETVILYTLPELAMVSSSMVRELAKYGRDVSRFLPPPVI